MFSLTRRAATVVSRRAFHASAGRLNEEGAAAAEGMMNLNFSMPHGAIYEDTPCALIRVPGAAGEFGLTAGHVPIIAELQAGTVLVYADKDGTPDEYFVSGGFAMYHENGNCDVAVVEAFKLEELDAAAIAKGLTTSQAAFDAEPAGSVEKGIAEVEVNTFTAMQKALESA